MAMVPGPKAEVGSPIRIEAAAKEKWREVVQDEFLGRLSITHMIQLD